MINKINPYTLILAFIFTANIIVEIFYVKSYMRYQDTKYWRDAYIESEVKRKLLKKEFDTCGDLITAQDYGICAVYYEQVQYLKDFIATNEEADTETTNRLY